MACLSVVLFLLLSSGELRAAGDTGRVTGLPLPRFASVAGGAGGGERRISRLGPGSGKLALWGYLPGAPVEIIAERLLYFRIRDWTGATSWIGREQLAGRRTAITMDGMPLYGERALSAPHLAWLLPGVILALEACGRWWCHVRVQGEKAGGEEGFVRKEALFGVRPDEIIE